MRFQSRRATFCGIDVPAILVSMVNMITDTMKHNNMNIDRKTNFSWDSKQNKIDIIPRLFWRNSQNCENDYLIETYMVITDYLVNHYILRVAIVFFFGKY